MQLFVLKVTGECAACTFNSLQQLSTFVPDISKQQALMLNVNGTDHMTVGFMAIGQYTKCWTKPLNWSYQQRSRKIKASEVSSVLSFLMVRFVVFLRKGQKVKTGSQISERRLKSGRWSSGLLILDCWKGFGRAGSSSQNCISPGAVVTWLSDRAADSHQRRAAETDVL